MIITDRGLNKALVPVRKMKGKQINSPLLELSREMEKNKKESMPADFGKIPNVI